MTNQLRRRSAYFFSQHSAAAGRDKKSQNKGKRATAVRV